MLATGRLRGDRVQLLGLETFSTLDAWEARLARGAWVGGFDLPFGLPRELIEVLGWPADWRTCVAHFCEQARPQLREQLAAFCNARPVGHKFAHRATDGPAGSSPSMKWVNPPVAWMLHAGVPALLRLRAWLPAHEAPCWLAAPDDEGAESVHATALRVALEAYPGLLAREVLSALAVRRQLPAVLSYKSDDVAKQTPARLLARKDLVTALEQGHTRLGLRLKLTPAQSDALVADGRGDALDAVLCLLQAAWALRQHQLGHALYGLPAGIDELEGWIISA